MTVTIVKRPPRRPAPAMPSGEVLLDPPPEIPPPAGKGWTRMLMALPMGAGAAAMGLMMGVQRGGPLTYVAGAMYGVSVLGMIAMMATSTSGPGRREMIESRRRYLRHLAQLRAQLRDTIRQQREALYYRNPDPGTLWTFADSGRLWERRRHDADFTVVRIAVGGQEVATRLIPPQTRPVDELEPLCAMALRRFVSTYSVVPDLPVSVALRDFSRVYLRGADAARHDLCRALVAQLVTFHAPDDLRLGICVPDHLRAGWEWAKWLPHAQHPDKTDAVGPVRLVAPSVPALEAMLDDVLVNRPRFDPAGPAPGGPHLVVIIDGGATAGSDHLMTEGGVAGVTVLDLSAPPPRLLDDSSVVLEIAADGTVTGATMDGATPVGRADALGAAQIEVLARELAPLRLSAATYGEQPAIAADMGLTELLAQDDPYRVDLATLWAGRPNRDRLRVPIGIGADGRPVELDLKESAQDGMGPHGLLIGATGSGKSELLRTLVVALALTHHPEILNFVLVDYKGGATFASLDRLPHTAAMITNLQDEQPLVDRMLGAIQGELTRRQELLRKAGNYASQRDYERARAAGVPLAPLPSLVLIVDEFSELLADRPDFIDMFVQIGRVGRSLGIHLLLASQKLEEGRLRGLESHLSYRIGLRTFSSMESRAVLGVPDAYELPHHPGHGYLRAGTDGLVRFKAAYVSGAVRREGAVAAGGTAAGSPIHDFSTYWAAPAPDERPEPVETGRDAAEPVRGDTLMDVLARQMEGRGAPAHEVWLPPLDRAPTLGQMLPPVISMPDRGLTVDAVERFGALHALAGIVDKPFDQRRDPLWLDLSGAAGNLLVVGGAQSGKSNLLRTLIAGLALTHTPREAQFYVLDFGGGPLGALTDLPHVGGVATRRDTDRVRRTIAEVHGVMRGREDLFARRNVEGMAAYRRSRAQGGWAEDPFGDVFLVIDGWSTLRSDFEDLEPTVHELANRGLGFGVHVIAAASRWMDVRPQIRDVFGTRVELRLGEPADSLINRREAVNVPERSPGRGLTPDGHHFLAALPRIDREQRTDDLAEAVAELVKQATEQWGGPSAPRVRLLPPELPFEALPPARGALVPIGIAEADLQPVWLDFDAEPHALLLGDIESGKSSFLRGLARSIVAGNTPAQARVLLVDLRRSLLGCVPAGNTIGYGTSHQVTAELIGQVAVAMRERLPGPDVTPEMLDNRSWWTGPHLYVLVDDYDLVAAAAQNPLLPLLEFLPQARDIGLHLVLTRRIGGAARAMFDPLIGRIRELAAPGIMMSGPREEGPLFGTIKPQTLPPGRAWMITRRQGARLVQLAWTPPAR
ncbi:type VII secretion protein EccCa [Actinoplanes teichomyceticus]|uniref:S-DNA-T family DNA segregation ATPase FtsK/SpoIIIE n=1 Tax=Actinoplanes teichomyceticus TaxID=1867 RepID=A0A561WIN4_ACTTI|nr:type VII secretion protein EccCa [Actinoplanes teichomyceticus]TWG23716.1 S-DNA-T family DNA segregation ATPase FtsK/SpoIIIE [Actinoplanes teichomyceticus]GIF11756.1 type VII secretion protein EccC [Actinoplanes teichomyceticus]